MTFACSASTCVGAVPTKRPQRETLSGQRPPRRSCAARTRARRDQARQARRGRVPCSLHLCVPCVILCPLFPHLPQDILSGHCSTYIGVECHQRTGFCNSSRAAPASSRVSVLPPPTTSLVRHHRARIARVVPRDGCAREKRHDNAAGRGDTGRPAAGRRARASTPASRPAGGAASDTAERNQGMPRFFLKGRRCNKKDSKENRAMAQQGRNRKH